MGALNMYAKRIQIANYGPIGDIDVAFPFDEAGNPKPVVLVGENGSGKTIFLSHIINGLIEAKAVAYPESPEIKTGHVYKLRSNSYIKSRQSFYFARVDFENGLFIDEIRASVVKQDDQTMPAGLAGNDAIAAWQRVSSGENDDFDSNITINNRNVEDSLSQNCVLYFPSNRFEYPAWLNEANLNARANYMDAKRLQGYTNRRIINDITLQDNQNWLFEVAYDSALEVVQSITDGDSLRTFSIASQIIRKILGVSDAKFDVGKRSSRVASVMFDNETRIPVFQLSSGETSLLNLFLSILRDYDLSDATPPQDANAIRGIVLVDEIDLHLHANHQSTILPELMRLFPRVQFVVTTHSPLFVLGIQKQLGDDGFDLYQMPEGQQISAEEFSEFENAYRSFAETKMFQTEIQSAIERSQMPILFMEGKLDVQYLRKAAELLGKGAVLQRVDLQEVGGSSELDKIRRNKSSIRRVDPAKKVILLYDCDVKIASSDDENFFERVIPYQEAHPIKKGVENLFNEAALEQARAYKPAFIDIEGEHTKEERGEKKTVPEEWTVNGDEKTNLCEWLCANGTEEDFQYFRLIFDVLEEILGADTEQTSE